MLNLNILNSSITTQTSILSYSQKFQASGYSLDLFHQIIQTADEELTKMKMTEFLSKEPDEVSGKNKKLLYHVQFIWSSGSKSTGASIVIISLSQVLIFIKEMSSATLKSSRSVSTLNRMNWTWPSRAIKQYQQTDVGHQCLGGRGFQGQSRQPWALTPLRLPAGPLPLSPSCAHSGADGFHRLIDPGADAPLQ